jgi:hypothetical protein
MKKRHKEQKGTRKANTMDVDGDEDVQDQVMYTLPLGNCTVVQLLYDTGRVQAAGERRGWLVPRPAKLFAAGRAKFEEILVSLVLITFHLHPALWRTHYLAAFKPSIQPCIHRPTNIQREMAFADHVHSSNHKRDSNTLRLTSYF